MTEISTETDVQKRFMHRIKRLEDLTAVEKKLVRSCKQIILLNDKLKGLTKRYYRARADGNKNFRYNIRVRVATMEGVRNMFYEYARCKAEEVAALRRELFNENVVIVTGSGRQVIGGSHDSSDEEMTSDDDDDDTDDEDDDGDDDDDDDIGGQSDAVPV